MATARKLPSGSWRCLVYDYTDKDGKRKYKSFTSDDPTSKGKRIAESLAAQWAEKKEATERNKVSITFQDAANKYIDERKNVLSPRTVDSYRKCVNGHLSNLADIKLGDFTQETVQEFVNTISEKLSPKTVRNFHGLISAVLSEFRPDFALHTVLPKKVKPKIYVPTEEEVNMLLAAAKGTDMELPVMLAAFGPMRRGEICALDKDHVDGTVVHVEKNMVITESKKWTIKAPKSYAGDRFIAYPSFVADKLSEIASGRITELNPDEITKRFEHLQKKAGIETHFRFHDLRHFCASLLHSMNIPDAYIMERGGWGNDSVLKNVYRHVLVDHEKEVNTKVNDYFEEHYATRNAT